MSPAIRIEVDDEQVLKALRGARKEMRRKVRDIQELQAKRIVLPKARALSPSFARRTMMIRSNSRGVFLATSARGKKRAIVGVANFGGTIKAPIAPKGAQALQFVDGGFAASVTGPRTIKGLHWMEEAVESTRDRFARASTEAIADWLQRYVRGQRALSRAL